MFLASLISWLIIYALGTRLEATRVQQGRWIARGKNRSTIALAATLVYTTIMIVAGVPILLLDFNVGSTNNEMQNLILSFSLGWFIVDTIWAVFEKFWKIDLFMQHLVCSAGLGWVLYTQRNGWEMLGAAGAGEIFPCLYLGLLAKRLKFGSERFFFVNDSIFVLSFIVIRYCFFSVLAYLVVGADETHPVLATLALLLLLINYYWGVRLVRKYLDKWGHKL
ncbi:MAG TPA: hypothetical protein VE954_37700 [Oligoflexus sp.]|uniref:hypothetical protein n=1 Tax=Oligoflexus sp. TaxID=1971216 RepID=UPI002D6A07C5|nr:hypothetical protein [Oligoflexus sp.]HYX38876.1 hypothetical protein [Oligoflexus sp.]